jgi:hypothetical protein
MWSLDINQISRIINSPGPVGETAQDEQADGTPHLLFVPMAERLILRPFTGSASLHFYDFKMQSHSPNKIKQFKIIIIINMIIIINILFINHLV